MRTSLSIPIAWFTIILLCVIGVNVTGDLSLEIAKAAAFVGEASVPPAPFIVPSIDADVHWPRTFDPVERANHQFSQSKHQSPRVSNSLQLEMAMTYGYCLAQNITIDMMTNKFPDLRQKLLLAQDEFELKFKPAIASIDQILLEKNPHWVRNLHGLFAQAN